MSSAPTFHYGKSENFILWLYQNIEYPKSALKDSLSGKVIARFLIDPIGAVKNIEIIKGVRNDLDSAVIKVLYASPCWTPAKQGNESIAVPFFVRVEFNIQDPDFKNKIILFSKQLKIKKN
jgi:protein TonB